MNINSFLFWMLGVGVGLLFSGKANAYLLDEQIIKTKDGQCQMRYLTEKNTKGWYVVSERPECGDDGWLDGYHNLVVYNAFSQPVETLYGYFSKGYWTGNTWVESTLLTRSSEELGIQKATFHVGKDEAREIDYIGQMIARKAKDGSYSGFSVCSPFRLLAVTKNIEFFENPKARQIIFKDIEKNVRRFCPTEKKVMLFVSPTVEPEQSDIVLYVDLDLQAHSSNLIWQSEIVHTRIVQQQNENGGSVNQVTNSNDLEKIRQEVYQKIRKIGSYSNSVQPERIVISEESYPLSSKNKEEERAVSQEEPVVDLSLSDERKKQELVSEGKDTPQELEQSKEHTVEDVVSDVNVVKKEETSSFKDKKTSKDSSEIKNIQKKQERAFKNKKPENLPIQPVMHLFVASKVARQPVLGKAAVHISPFALGGHLIADIPVKMTLQGKTLKSGWYLVSGYFDATTHRYPKKDVFGNVRLLTATPCVSSYCKEEK